MNFMSSIENDSFSKSMNGSICKGEILDVLLGGELHCRRALWVKLSLIPKAVAFLLQGDSTK